VEEARQHRALEAAACAQAERREVRRLGYTDLCVRRGDAPFGAGDVGPALKQLGG
jgi:hypothetical protein